jgi:hypothetical protein
MHDRTSRRTAGVQCLDQYFLREYESPSRESRSGGKHDEPGHPHHKDERQNYRGDKADTNEYHSDSFHHGLLSGLTPSAGRVQPPPRPAPGTLASSRGDSPIIPACPNPARHPGTRPDRRPASRKQAARKDILYALRDAIYKSDPFEVPTCCISRSRHGRPVPGTGQGNGGSISAHRSTQSASHLRETVQVACQRRSADIA